MLRRIFKWLLITIITLVALSVLWVIAYRFIPVPGTPLMLIRNITDDIPVKHEWTPLEKIAPDMQLAVIAAEDSYFMQHSGFDWEQIEKAQADAKKGKKLRGASTISQQTAKNVFLWNGRSWLRKGLEAYYTMLIELIWGKERIMEVYLNCIEMGNGIYGASAVAQHHFDKKASQLSRNECALIAASLPNPRKMNSSRPSKYMYKRQKAILRLMRLIGEVKYK